MIQETDLREMFTARAEDVDPPADAFPRLLARRRRIRRRNAVVAGVLAGALVGAAGTWATTARFPGGSRMDTATSAAERLYKPLLDSPTRGSLANDSGYVQEFLQGLHKYRKKNGVNVGQDLSKVRVLFIGDVPGGRAAAVYEPGGYGTTALFGAAGAASAQTLAASADSTISSGSSHGFVNDGYIGSPYPVLAISLNARVHATLVLAPSRYTVSVSDQAHYLANGTIRRNWTVPAGSAGCVRGCFVTDSRTLLPGARIRFMDGNRIYYEDKIPSRASYDNRHGKNWLPDGQTIQQAMVGAAGTVSKPLVEHAIAMLAADSGLTSRNATYRVLWGGSPNNGLNEKGVPTVVVAAITPDGGGPYLVATAGNNQSVSVAGEGVMGAPASSFAVWRNDASYRCQRGKPCNPRLLMIGPPGATRADIRTSSDNGLPPHPGGLSLNTPFDHGLAKFPLRYPGKKIEVWIGNAQHATIAAGTRTELGKDDYSIERAVRPW